MTTGERVYRALAVAVVGAIAVVVVLGAGMIVSALAWVVERVARSTAASR